jgi:hypothetical protein
MHVVITKESRMDVFSISPFEPKLVLMFFHIDSIKEFITLVQTWAFATFISLSLLLGEEIIRVKKIPNYKWRGRI